MHLIWSVSPEVQLDFLQNCTSNLTWLLLTLCSSCYSLHPFTMRPTGPYSKQAHCLWGNRLIPSIPPLFPDWTETKGTIVGKRLPEQALVSFSSGSELIPLRLGNQRGEKVGHCEASVLLKTERSNLSRYQVYLSSRHGKVIWILIAAWVMLLLQTIPLSKWKY